MKKVLFLLSFAIILFSSCTESGEKKEVNITKDMAVRIINDQTKDIGLTSYKCTFKIDWMNSVMNIIIVDGSDSANGAIELRDINFHITTDGYVFNIPTIIPYYNDVQDSKLTYTNLSGLMLDGEIKFQMTRDSNTYYATVGNAEYKYSTTDVINTTDATVTPKPFTIADVKYVVNLNIPAKTANITITGAKFTNEMTAVNLSIIDIPIIATAEGFNVEIKSVAGTTGDSLNPQYNITNLSGKLNNGNFDLSYTCNEIYSTTVKASMHKTILPQ